jgi:hypothetical protein
MKNVDRKAPVVRSFTLSGGSFRGEIVIDHRPPSPPSPTDGFKNSSIHSLPPKFTHSVSSLADTDDSSATCATTQLKPTVEILEVRKKSVYSVLERIFPSIYALLEIISINYLRTLTLSIFPCCAYTVSSISPQEMVAALTDTEKESAGRSSYQYSKLSDTIQNRGPWINRIRDNAAGEMAARHWVAEKGDTPKALKQFRETIQYFVDKKVPEIIHCFQEDTANHKRLRNKVTKYLGPAGRLFVRGYDREGRACMHFIAKNSPLYSKADPEGCMEAYFYMLEKAFACTEKRSRGTLGKVNVSVDFKDFIKWHSPPLNVVKDMLVMLKDHYPERLHKVYLVDAPVVFRALWSIIKPFLDPDTKHKFIFVTGEQQRMEVFGSIMDKDNSMPYQRPDGTLVEDVDMDKLYSLPYQVAYDEV